MTSFFHISAFILAFGSLGLSEAFAAPAPSQEPASENVEISADTSLEWNQKSNIYLARGNAKAVRGGLTVMADILTAHQREAANKPKDSSKTNSPDGGDIDQMTAEGNVVILQNNARITGDRAINDIDKHMTILTGKNLRYESEGQVVTARDSLEYWDETKTAIARGNARAVKEDQRISADILTAEFRPGPSGNDQLSKITATGNVVVVTKNDVTRGNKAVYDAARNIAIISGNVRITRADGTLLTGDVGESDFAKNQSRLLNDGTGRVRALLPAKTTSRPAKGDGGTR